MQEALGAFQSLPPVELREMIGLWTGQGIPSGHPFDGVLETLGWFGKRFTSDMHARGRTAVSLRRAAVDPDRPGKNTRCASPSVSTKLAGGVLGKTCFPIFSVLFGREALWLP
jgi:hypothetical protein